MGGGGDWEAEPRVHSRELGTSAFQWGGSEGWVGQRCLRKEPKALKMRQEVMLCLGTKVRRGIWCLQFPYPLFNVGISQPPHL